MNGVINFYKPPGMSSAQAVAFIKRMTGEKTGHAGTLDPEAAGVLPILSGRATRICDYLMDGGKQYLAEIAFGAATDTQDAQGKVIRSGDSCPDMKALQDMLPRFTGEIQQMPPQYSALKIGGETAYKLARNGQAARLKHRQVQIDEIVLLGETFPHGFLMRIRCGKGTYIRTLCHDIGTALGCPAHLRFLLREESAGLSLKDAVTPVELAKWGESGKILPQPWFLSMAEALSGMPRYEVPPALARQAVNGVPLPTDAVIREGQLKEKTKVCLFLGEELLGIFAVEGQILKVSAMLTDIMPSAKPTP